MIFYVLVKLFLIPHLNQMTNMIEGYNLIRCDHSMRGRVCIYYKESLAIYIVNITKVYSYLEILEFYHCVIFTVVFFFISLDAAGFKYY